MEEKLDEESIYYVYGYIRLDTNTYFYIGKGKGNRCFKLNGRNKYFTNIINKVDCVVEILYDNLTEDEAFQLEVDIIYDLVFNEGYSIEIKGINKNKGMHLVNQTWGGEGMSGYNLLDNMTDDAIKERSRKLSESSSGKNNIMYGKTHDEEARKKMSEANVGRWIGENSPCYGNGIKIAQIDKDTNEIINIFNCERDANEKLNKPRESSCISNSVNGRVNLAYDYKWRKIDEDGNIIPTEWDFKNIKKLAMIDKETNNIIKTFSTIIDANLYLGKDRKNRSISSCLNGKCKTVFGYKWMWIYEEQKHDFNGKEKIKYKIAMIDRHTDEIVKIFNTIKEAKDYFGCNDSNHSIHRCLKGEQRTSYGYKWEYIDEKVNIIINKNNL